MPQIKLQVDQIKGNDAAADKLKTEGEALDAVKWVNIHKDTGVVVVTFGDGYDESAFQAIVNSL